MWRSRPKTPGVHGAHHVRHFMRQFVDLYLAPVELTVLLDEQTAQFVGAELIKVGGQCDGRHDAARKPN